MTEDARAGRDAGDPIAALDDALAGHPLRGEVTPRRYRRMLEVAASRLGSVTVVLENLWDPHNVSAVIRSAEGIGIDEAHVVEQPHRFRVNRGVARGAERWLRIRRHPDIVGCIARLASEGFVTCAADVGPGCLGLPELPLDRPIAIVLGSEKDGLTTEAKVVTDLRFTIPMAGMTESFNVSVSAAIALWDLCRRRRALLGAAGDLALEDRVARVAEWLARQATSRLRGRPAPGPT
ncbi:MAG TPA: RNA methyltransferase [Thermoanaerobaculia bacterium]|nr:RNA methyltransferase [Thermoanaerobaculia bacterium]